MSQRFPDLGDGLQTRHTLHAYSRLLGAVRRLLMPPHPRWWHISLELAPQGLTTGQIPAPSEARVGNLELTLNLRRSRLALGADGDPQHEWFGSHRVEHEQEGEARETTAQLGFGFSTGDDSHPEAYFYATPSPFEEPFLEGSLPAAARWQTVGWQGGLLPYTLVRRDGPEALSGFLRAVYETAAPHLN